MSRLNELLHLVENGPPLFHSTKSPLIWCQPEMGKWVGWVVFVGPQQHCRCWTKWGAERVVRKLKDEQGMPRY